MDWNALAAVAGAVGAGVAAWQLWRIRVDAFDMRAAEIESVSLVMTVLVRPTGQDSRSGCGAWTFEYTVHNPGRLPISDVCATITLPCDVQRRHHDGTVDISTRTVEIRTPVIAPGGSHVRSRTLLIDNLSRSTLHDTRAAVSFQTPDAGRHTTHWPAPKTRGSSSLRRRLQGERR